VPVRLRRGPATFDTFTMVHADTHPTLQGQLLIAMPSLQDSYFTHAVTYLCEHNDQGAMGLVVNQPAELNLDQLLRQVEIEPADDLPLQTVFRGGPVQPEHGFVLHTSEHHWTGTRPIADSLALTTSRDILADMAVGRGPLQALVALGYAGWGPGQLESELAENAWLVVPASPSILFSLPPDQRWDAAAQLMGIDLNLISQVAGHA
jgi:putative transcriptional regulator